MLENSRITISIRLFRKTVARAFRHARSCPQAFAEQSLAAPVTLVSDGLGCFTAVRDMGILHEPHVTGGGAASAKHPSFLAVNTALGNIKTSLSGIYHAFGFRRYAHRYLGQVQYLFNRRLGLRNVLERLARASTDQVPSRGPGSAATSNAYRVAIA